MYKSWERIALRKHAQVRNHVQSIGGGSGKVGWLA